jgi:tripartite-type tricarboxylate transporter receptor subunit TctC
MDRISSTPTAQEAGVDVSMASERGLAAPLNLPADIAARLESLVADVLKDPEFIAASQADAPVLNFLPGKDWEAQLRNDEALLRPLAEKLKN